MLELQRRVKLRAGPYIYQISISKNSIFQDSYLEFSFLDYFVVLSITVKLERSNN